MNACRDDLDSKGRVHIGAILSSIDVRERQCRLGGNQSIECARLDASELCLAPILQLEQVAFTSGRHQDIRIVAMITNLRIRTFQLGALGYLRIVDHGLDCPYSDNINQASRSAELFEFRAVSDDVQ